ncbi:MAG: HD domain-containing protein [Betaproteobacteria bacterium]|nr:HD domain-containing protein [Betaproteobacteria bacterium]
MDIKEIIAPVVQDWEMLEEFSDNVQEKAFNTTLNMARLRETPGDFEPAFLILRDLHSLKGGAALSKLELGVAVTHHVGALVSRFLDGQVPLSRALSEAILLALDRLSMAVENLIHHDSLEDLKLIDLLQYLEKATQAPPDEVDAICGLMIESVTGFPSVLSGISHVTAFSADSAQELHSEQKHDVASDLQFFRTFAIQLENRSPFFKGRTNRILRLALETNKAADSPVDPVQLEAAIYMHDLGMLLLPEQAWLKVGRLSAEDKLSLRKHPAYGAGLLQRMHGWEAASVMVAQHHEMPNGNGYPANLKDDEICPGAKIIAIVDTFEAVMLKHSHRGKNRSVLRAIAEVNACDNQFDAEWTRLFNQIIRRTIGMNAG